MPSWAIFWGAAQGSENILPMHVICDCAVALTETFEDVEVEASQKVTVHHGYVRPNRLGIHTAFSCLKALLPSHPPSGSGTGDANHPLAYLCCFCFFLLFPVLGSSLSRLLHCLIYHTFTSTSAFHSDFKVCFPLPAFPTYLHDFSFEAADPWSARFLIHFSFNP